MAQLKVPRRIVGRWVIPAGSRTIHGTTLRLASEVVYRWLPCLCGERIALPSEPPRRVTAGADGHNFCPECTMHFAVIVEPCWQSATDHYPDWLRLSGAVPPSPN